MRRLESGSTDPVLLVCVWGVCVCVWVCVCVCVDYVSFFKSKLLPSQSVASRQYS